MDSRLQSVLGVALTKDEHARLLRFVTQRCRSLRLELQLYGLLFRHLRPRLVFFEDGCYGRLAPIIRLARDMGVRTAELQHGFVSLSHEAYNLAPTLLASQAYARFLPEFFLAYGNWWAKRMRVPMETVVVGNPHYDAMRRQWCHGVSERVSILVLSNGLDFNVFLELATTLHAALGNRYRVILRPHPIERESVARKYPDRSVGVTIDYSDNLYGRLAQAYAVVGETSTGLFEAAGLAERVFSMTSPTTSFYLPDNPFESFANTGELVEKLRDTHSGRVAPELLGSIWAEGWNDQYRSFLSKHSLLPSDGQADFGRQQRKH